MSMIKLASPSDWSALQDRPPVEIKLSSRGFLAGDRSKVAAEVGDRFIHEVRAIEDDLDRKNFKYAHTISCGATEYFGPNRNADGWSKKALAADMHTYLKHAKCFRNHRNKKSDEYFGRPKIAMYDGDRGYGRLLSAFHATKEACGDDPLAKIASREIDLLDRQGEAKVSHGTKVGYDVCVICSNKAANRKEYCRSKTAGGKCHLFGCRDGLSKIAEDGRIQFVDNPNNVFYDISMIDDRGGTANQADRIAFMTPMDEVFNKASSEGICRGSAWIAEQLGLQNRFDLCTFGDATEHQKRLMKTAIELVGNEPALSGVYDDYSADITPFQALVSDDLGTKQSAVAALAAKRQFIGPRVFAKLHGQTAKIAEEVAVCSRGLLRRVCEDDRLLTLVKASGFSCEDKHNELLAKAMRVGDAKALLTPSEHSARVKIAAITEPTQVDQISPIAGKIAIEYSAMKILYATHFLRDPCNGISLLG